MSLVYHFASTRVPLQIESPLSHQPVAKDDSTFEWKKYDLDDDLNVDQRLKNKYIDALRRHDERAINRLRDSSLVGMEEEEIEWVDDYLKRLAYHLSDRVEAALQPDSLDESKSKSKSKGKGKGKGKGSRESQDAAFLAQLSEPEQEWFKNLIDTTIKEEWEIRQELNERLVINEQCLLAFREGGKVALEAELRSIVPSGTENKANWVSHFTKHFVEMANQIDEQVAIASDLRNKGRSSDPEFIDEMHPVERKWFFDQCETIIQSKLSKSFAEL